MFVAASAAHAQNPVEPGFFVDTQVLWFDSEITGDFELAPRFIAGYDNTVGMRVRYWTYDHAAEVHRNHLTHQRLDFDVIDLEATTHIRWEYTDFQFAGGARIAHIDHTTYRPLSQPVPETDFEKTTMGGITAAGEGRTHLFRTDVCGAAFVYGGRLSMLQGDWEGNPGAASYNVQNDRFIVPEVFTGVEAHYGQVFARMTVEMQEWKGRDVGLASRNYGFTGYGVNLGYSF